jgi:RHS repeat-associated protein
MEPSPGWVFNRQPLRAPGLLPCEARRNRSPTTRWGSEWCGTWGRQERLSRPAGQELGEYYTGGPWWGWQAVRAGGRLIANYWYQGANGSTEFTHMNALGSIGMVTDASGATVMDETRYPWGQEWSHTGSRYDERFASMGWHDYSSGLDPTLFRHYNSTLGRWMSPDPLGGDVSNPQSLNRYGYVIDNPLSLVDPMGLSYCDSHPDAKPCNHEPGAWNDVGALAESCISAGLMPTAHGCGWPLGTIDDDPFGSGLDGGIGTVITGLGSSGPLSGDYGANLPPPSLWQIFGPGYEQGCEFGPCDGGLGGFGAEGYTSSGKIQPCFDVFVNNAFSLPLARVGRVLRNGATWVTGAASTLYLAARGAGSLADTIQAMKTAGAVSAEDAGEAISVLGTGAAAAGSGWAYLSTVSGATVATAAGTVAIG